MYLVDQIAEIDSAEAKWQGCLQDPDQAESQGPDYTRDNEVRSPLIGSL